MTIQIPKQVLSNAMDELNRIEVFFTAIALISDQSPDKNGFCTHMLANEGERLCSKLHEAIDRAKMESSRINKEKGE
jgi:hypothetical protein